MLFGAGRTNGFLAVGRMAGKGSTRFIAPGRALGVVRIQGEAHVADTERQRNTEH